MQAHTVITNITLLAVLTIIMFFSTDFHLPIINRFGMLDYSSTFFFNYSLVVIFLFPISLVFYVVFKQAMGLKGERKTLFLDNKKPTWWLILSGILTTILLIVLVLINIIGRISSSKCFGNDSTIGLQCSDSNWTIYCRNFFGPQGFIDLHPLYLNKEAGLENL